LIKAVLELILFILAGYERL